MQCLHIQDIQMRQCACDVTLRPFRINCVVTEMQKFELFLLVIHIIIFNYIKMLCHTKILWSQIYVTGKYKTFLDHNVIYRCFFLSESNLESLDISRVSYYQISRKSVHWELRWYIRKDGRTGTTKLAGALRHYDDAPKIDNSTFPETMVLSTKLHCVSSPKTLNLNLPFCLPIKVPITM
jgi:hypothetical protein